MTVKPDVVGDGLEGGSGLAGEPAHPADASNPVVANRAHFPGFDGLRAIAAVAVLFTHVGAAAGSYSSTYWGKFLAHMDAGVAIFFLLSGFLLYRPFVSAHLADRSAPRLGDFYWRRALRILPAYWLVLTVTILVFGTVDVHNAGDVFYLYGFAQIYSRAHLFTGIVQAWSLCVEISFYLFLPLFALAIRALAIPVARRFRAELIAVCGLIVIGLGTHALLLWSHSQATPSTLWLPSQLDLFGLGMGLAVISVWVERRGAAPRWIDAIGRYPALWWLLAGLTFFVISTQLGLRADTLNITKRQEMLKQVFYGATGFFLLLPAVFGNQERGRIRWFLRSRVVAWVGLVSYGVFLWHKDLIELLAPDNAFGRPVLPSWIPAPHFLSLLVLTLAMTLVAAALSYYFVERPALRLKRRPPWRRNTEAPVRAADTPAA